MKLQVICLITLTLLAGCKGNGPGSGLFRATSPHELYERSLKTAQLDQTALGTDWQKAAQRALHDSIIISVPYRESGYFGAGQAVAMGYRLAGVRGDKFTVRVSTRSRQPVRLFVDVFALDGAGQTPIASAKTDTTAIAELIWEPRRTQTYLIRVQPELLRSGQYTIGITREPVLRFPVQGRTSKQISSYFGVPRDGGRRRHEGIDIFAPRGTPAIASVAGIITEVGQNKLGGNVVFLTDNERQQRLYYAHLDRFNVANGQSVKLGDTLGFVGNTGNARTIEPHLHFGVYTFADGAVNPLPYVRLGRGPAQQPLPAETLLGDSGRIAATGPTPLRLSPGSDAPVLRALPRQQLVTILGGTALWLRVCLPDGQVGYVASKEVDRINKPFRYTTCSATGSLLDEADSRAAPITDLQLGTSVGVLGQTGNFWLVRTGAGQTGWVPKTGLTE